MFLFIAFLAHKQNKIKNKT